MINNMWWCNFFINKVMIWLIMIKFILLIVNMILNCWGVILYNFWVINGDVDE